MSTDAPSLSQLIRAYAGLSPKAVAEALCCCPRYVSQVRWRDKRRAHVNACARNAAKLRRERALEQPVWVTLEWKDPRWAAWLQFFRNTGRADLAVSIEMARAPVVAEAEWPPETPDVPTMDGPKGTVLGFYLPAKSPEWASHLQALRNSPDRKKRDAGSRLLNSPAPYFAKVRWAQPGKD